MFFFVDLVICLQGREFQREERALSSICSEVEQPSLEPALLWEASIQVAA